MTGSRAPVGDSYRRLSVVIPCYNEDKVLDALIARLIPVCEQTFPNAYEIVFVNDGSTDRTWPIISDYIIRSSHILGVDLSRNHGHQLALTAGLQFATGDLILVIDADLQDPPELLPQMLQKVREGYDVVYGQRTRRRGDAPLKRATAAGFYRLLERLVDIPIPRDTGDFRLMTRRVVDQLNAMPEGFRFIRGMVSWVGFDQIAIEYERDARFDGETHYPLNKMLVLAFDAITGFSIAPLRLASHIGIGFGLLGICLLFWVFIGYLNHDTITGWTSVIGVILILGSAQLILLGVFGEYLGRMYIEAKRRPLFVVREVRGCSNRPAEPHEPVATERQHAHG
jgi:dolichol-phosphate mannosyltransferase